MPTKDYLRILCFLVIMFCFLVIVPVKSTAIDATPLKSLQVVSIEPISSEEIPSVSQTPTAPPEPKYVKISAVGDFMLHKWQHEFAYNKTQNHYNFDYSFEDIKPYLENADYTIGNFETVLAGENAAFSDYPRFNAPYAYADAIKNAGVDLLTTANNHGNDQYEAGIINTLTYLTSIGFDVIGTYSSSNDRDTIFVKEINDIKFAFLSYSYGTNGMHLPKGKEYLLNLLDENLIKNDITKAKELGVDFIVVLPHMGNEYQEIPHIVYKNWVDFMFEAGADIVLASHPHVLQTAEFKTITDKDGNTRTCFVAYSLGNFFSSQRTQPRDAGVIMNLYFEKIYNEKPTLKEVTITPTWVKFRNAKGESDIQVLSVYDSLLKQVNGASINLRGKDISRIETVNKDAFSIFNISNGTPLQPEYSINKQ